MFIEALFTIAKIWKQPKCPSTDEWIKKMWYIYIYIKKKYIYIYIVCVSIYTYICIYTYVAYTHTHTHTMEYYSAIKKNEILPFATRMDLEGIMLSEISQTEKDKYCMMSLICGILKIK